MKMYTIGYIGGQVYKTERLDGRESNDPTSQF